MYIWDARNLDLTDGGLEFWIRVVDGPDVMSVAGLASVSSSNPGKMESMRVHLWGPTAPLREMHAPLRMSSGKKALICLSANRMPSSTDSRVFCAVKYQGQILPAKRRGEIVNKNDGGGYRWKKFASIAAPTESSHYTSATVSIRT